MTDTVTDTTITYEWQVSRLECLPMAPEGADYVVTAYRLPGTAVGCRMSVGTIVYEM